MTDLDQWHAISTLIQTGGPTVLLIGIVLGFLRGMIHTGAAYEAIAKDRDEWRTAYRTVADVALRQVLDNGKPR